LSGSRHGPFLISVPLAGLHQAGRFAGPELPARPWGTWRAAPMQERGPAHREPRGAGGGFRCV